jgi:hypothetical protein
VKIFYYGPQSRPGSCVGHRGELRIVSLVGLWDKVKVAMADGGHLRLAHAPIMAYLREASASRPDCLLCGHPLEAAAHPVSMVVLVLPQQPELDPVMVSALCEPCCAAEPNDDRLLLTVEAVLQQAQIAGPDPDLAPSSMARQ